MFSNTHFRGEKDDKIFGHLERMVVNSLRSLHAIPHCDVRYGQADTSE
jgi:hypothetical protein